MKVEDIETIFYFDILQYIEIYGLEKDKERAIRLLIKTPLAWHVLDPELKKDPEVILYYQPSGIVEQDVKVANPLFYFSYEEGPTYYSEADFSVTNTDELLKQGRITEDTELDVEGTYLIPDIEFPEGFDFERYFLMQTRMVLYPTYSVAPEFVLFFPKKEEVDWSIFRETKVGVPMLLIYNRNSLRRMFLESKKGRAINIGKHPGAR